MASFMQGIHGFHQVFLEKQESLVEGNAELFESTTKKHPGSEPSHLYKMVGFM